MRNFYINVLYLRYFYFCKTRKQNSSDNMKNIPKGTSHVREKGEKRNH